MLIGEKITALRKKNGWSQEELADKMNVSRQAVSKWESDQTIPDLDKVLILSKLFNVTTDYLLKDEIENQDFVTVSNQVVMKHISSSFACEFMVWRKKASLRIALGVFLCIISVIPLIFLASLTTVENSPINELFASILGLILLLIFVTLGVILFISCEFKNAPYKFIDKEPFELEYGVKEMIQEKQNAYHPTYIKINIIATAICILSPISLFIGILLINEFLIVSMLCITIFLVGIATFLFIYTGVQYASTQKLLKEGDFDLHYQRKNRIKGIISSIFWECTTAIYLLWSFLSNDWGFTWIIWPIAAIIFLVIDHLCNLFFDKDKEDE